MTPANAPSLRALVLFAHGSREAAWAAPFRGVQRQIASQNPGLSVELAFLEMMEPGLPPTLARLARAGVTKVTIAPLFMAQGAHLRRDLTEMLAAARHAHPGMEIVLLPAVGEAQPVLDAISTWVARHA